MRIIIKKSFFSMTCLFWLVLAQHALAQKPALNNISMLFPMPKETMEDLPGLGAPVELMGLELFRGLPNLVPTPLTLKEQYRHTRLVSLRWDPEEKEARLIFQPMTEFYDGSSVTSIVSEDAALHLFYRAPSRDAVVNELRKIQRGFGRNESLTQLGVHKGFQSAADVPAKMSAALKQISNWQLYKVTFMTERQNNVMWHFGGFEVNLGEHGERILGPALLIPNLERTLEDPNRGVPSSSQRIVRGFARLRANVNPLAVGSEHLNETFTEGARWFESNTQTRVQEMRTRVDRLENPKVHSPKTMDCVSCHAVESTSRILARDYGAESSSSAMPLPAGYGLTREIKSLTMENTINFRSFGYFFTEPSVSRRVLLETYLFQQAL